VSAGARFGLPLPLVCLVTDRKVVRNDGLVEAVAAAVSGGVNLVQLREKDLPTRELLDLALRLRAAVEPFGVPLVVNGRADVAFAAGATGVHLPADGLPVAGARAVLGSDALIGRSVHSPAEAGLIAGEPVDYLVLGTIFASVSHPESLSIGVEAIRAAAGSRVPLLAIGGITPENADSVVAAGADGVAVISAILGQSEPQRAARELCQVVEQAWRTRVQPSPGSTADAAEPVSPPGTGVELTPSPSGRGMG
jgi:thiamine-phosphate pyrophosphorylase